MFSDIRRQDTHSFYEPHFGTRNMFLFNQSPNFPRVLCPQTSTGRIHTYIMTNHFGTPRMRRVYTTGKINFDFVCCIIVRQTSNQDKKIGNVTEILQNQILMLPGRKASPWQNVIGNHEICQFLNFRILMFSHSEFTTYINKYWTIWLSELCSPSGIKTFVFLQTSKQNRKPRGSIKSLSFPAEKASTW